MEECVVICITYGALLSPTHERVSHRVGARKEGIAAAHLHAENYHILSNKMTNEELVKKAAAVKVTEFVAKKVKIAVTDQEGRIVG